MSTCRKNPLATLARVVQFGALFGLAITGASAVESAPLAFKPDALLQIDLNRSSVVEKIVSAWEKEIPAAQIDSFRNKLSALRADQLLAANVSGAFDGALEIVNKHERSATTAPHAPAHFIAAATPQADQSKALGDPTQDLVYTPITPCRIADTRSASAAGIPNPMLGNVAYRIKSFSSAGFANYGGSAADCAIPTSGEVRAIVANVIGLQQAGLPNFTAYVSVGDSNVLPTLLSNAALNFNALQGANATVVIPTNASGDLYMAMPTGLRGNFIVEVSGYFMPPSRNGDGLRVIAATDVVLGSTPNVVNGDSTNRATKSDRGTFCLDFTRTLVGATVSGGTDNRVTDVFSTVAGGIGNTAGNAGCINPVDGGYATVSGGSANTASGNYSTVAGGDSNIASNSRSVVSGGNGNLASGIYSTVPGGNNNTASAPYSFAAGHRAKATTSGSFVWADDSTGAFDFDPAAQGSFGVNVPNTFHVRATGGVRFATGISGAGGVITTGCFISPFASAWSCTSDRALKERVEAISPRRVLDQLVAMPVSTWSLIASNVRQMGPMAQDFKKAFGLGESDTSINSIDAQGVAFAAIQGLNQKFDSEKVKLVAESKAKDAKISAQAQKLSALARELAVIKKKLGL
jgi:hypothetical protein